MKPYYQEGGITIYHADCREILPEMERSDLLLTDPPYGLGNRWQGAGIWQHQTGMYKDAKAWDQERIEISLLDKLIKNCRVAIIWGGNLYPLPISRCWLAWDKPQKMYTVSDFELAWTNMDKPSKSFTANRNNHIRRKHPTQKPVELFRWCIGQAGEEIGTILDPFMGSGTTLVAAKKLGRRAIGIEIEEQYCEIAVRRLAQGALDLWGEE